MTVTLAADYPASCPRVAADLPTELTFTWHRVGIGGQITAGVCASDLLLHDFDSIVFYWDLFEMQCMTLLALNTNYQQMKLVW